MIYGNVLGWRIYNEENNVILFNEIGDFKVTYLTREIGFPNSGDESCASFGMG